MKCSKCYDSFDSEEALDEHDKNFHSCPKYICDICKTTFVEQFKFFEHLKAHYESSSLPTISDYEAASILVDASNSGPAQTANNGLILQVSHGELLVEEDENKLTRPLSSEKKHFKIENDQDNQITVIHSDLMPSTSAGVVGSATMTLADDSPDKVLLTCPKCRRTFRKEKTYQIHITGTICGYRGVDGQENGEVDRVKGKGKKVKLKSEVVLLCKDETSEELADETLEEGIELDNTLDDDDQMELEEEDEEDGIFPDGNLCPGCDEVYPSRAKLEVHLKKAHPDLASSSTTKGGKKKKAIGQRRQEVLKCSECNRIFNHRNSLVYHMRSHTGERPHQCEMCGKSFFATSALKVHMRLHSGEKPYKCDHCGRHFRQWGDLKYHVISIHSDIRQYQCEFCGKDFARKYSLIVHRRIHTGERNYKCEFCGKCFRAASYLQNHRRIHTGEKPHACNICGKPFRVRSDMKRHMASHNRDHGHNRSSINAASVATTMSNQQTSQSLQSGTTVVTVSNATTSQLIAAVGSQMSQQIVRGGQTIQLPVSALSQTTQLVQQHGSLEDSNDAVISGDISEGTPINIILSQEACGTEEGSISATTVATLQASDLPDGVLYQNRDGQMEAVTIRESSTGTLYVWPVFMN